MLCCGGSKNTKSESIMKVEEETIDNSHGLFKSLPGKSNMKLIQLQVVVRHGARTPLNFIPGLEEATYDKSLDDDLPETMFDYEVVKFEDGTPAGETVMEPNLRRLRLKGGCRASTLTTVGQKQMFDLGKRIGLRYLPELELLKYSSENVRLRSSHLERTIKSLRSFLAGVFGKHHLESVGPIKIPVKNIMNEDIFPNKLSCPALRFVVDLTLSQLDTLPNYNDDRIAMLRALGRPTNLMLDFACLRDDIASRVAHGGQYPRNLLPFKNIIETNAARTIHAVYTGLLSGRSRHDVTKLAIGRLLYTIVDDMEKATKGERSPKLFIYSGHDTTLVPMLEALGLWEFEWPPFAASICYELYRQEKGGMYYVRVLYCGEAKRLRDQNQYLIPFDKFKQVLNPFLLPPNQIHQACLIQSGV